jgi:ubiquitin-conjugating enzyme E2 Q
MCYDANYSIEVPTEFGITESQLLDKLPEPDMRRALAWLIEQLPAVSELKKRLEGGEKLKDISVYPGAIGVLRWVVGSCRAYLRESRPGEGVLATGSEASAENVRQFTFVVGSPEQESNFKQEIERAQARDSRLLQYPTIMAFHGEFCAAGGADYRLCKASLAQHPP